MVLVSELHKAKGKFSKQVIELKTQVQALRRACAVEEGCSCDCHRDIYIGQGSRG